MVPIVHALGTLGAFGVGIGGLDRLVILGHDAAVPTAPRIVWVVTITGTNVRSLHITVLLEELSPGSNLSPLLNGYILDIGP